MATPTLQAIRRRFADASITFLLNRNTVDVIAGSPWTDDIVTWPPRGRKGRQPGAIRLGLQLRRHRFDWAVLLSNSFRSAVVACLAGAHRRIGYDRDGRGWMLTDRLAVHRENGEIARTRMVDYYGRLAQAIGCNPPGERLVLYTTPDDEQRVDERFAALGLSRHRPRIVITPGASFGPAKRWPPSRFAAVCDRLAQEFHARIILTYGPGERELAREVASAMQHPPVVLDDPPCTLGQLKVVVKRSDLLLCNDTGPRHFAKAFDVPVVTIFGPTWPEWTDTDYDMERKVRIDVDCGPCQQPVCPLGHLECMTGVTVDAVFDAASELLVSRLAVGR
jgi:heptosyltransferase-2